MSAAADVSKAFASKATLKLMSSIFGEGKDARSTDVAIVNNTGRTLYLGGHVIGSGGSGGWVGDFPPEELKPNVVAVYRVASHGVSTGCTECEVSYSRHEKNQGNHAACEYRWYTSNPYCGANHAGQRGGDGQVIVMMENQG